MKFSEEYIISLITAYQQQIISKDELNDLKLWLNEKPEHKRKFAEKLALLKEAGALRAYADIRLEKNWNAIVDGITSSKKEGRQRKLSRWIPYAAASVLVLGISLFFLFHLNDNVTRQLSKNSKEIGKQEHVLLTLSNGMTVALDTTKEGAVLEEKGTTVAKEQLNSISYSKRDTENAEILYNQIEVPRGGDFMVQLSDDTKVWLNSESRLKYPVQFTGDVREVELIGEAYFEVAHHVSKSFIVKAPHSAIKVLGTKFNVSAYTDDAKNTTTLLEGSVEVSATGVKRVLEPGYQAVVDKDVKQVRIAKVDAEMFTSWVHGVYRFENQSMEQITKQLSRWYPVDFEFSEVELKSIPLSGAIKKHKPIEFSFDLIKKIAPIDYRMDGNKVIIISAEN
ncbi:FecR family protein [Carboxylicivirga marina]|uniref:DUF4974 domain-containing protein n=1 Tax=Carboxylicivirga marina TaxID=2800988 RepID=A0ABS1HE01_9BACT|nr:FecR family protein [Carboxylicivirga marina]MBK3515847.1 DUF4974 domain-containing protein [Carboxylicivirga marina]